MKTAILYLFLLLSHWSNGQKLSGNWQGACSITDTSNPLLASSSWIYLDMSIVKGMIDGKMRHENSLEGQYYLYDIVGKVLENGHLEINETRLGHKSKNAIPSDKQQFDFEYDTKKGYLLGKSKDGKSMLTLYRANFNISENTPNILPINQLAKFQQDLADGLSSPEKRLEELRAFKFEPIYFEYDKDIIQAQYELYLIEMIRMVKSHSDLRILITGHTDSDGSDAYNISLSKRRAASLERFFEAHGLPKSRVEIDFKGENEPVDRNDTSAGKQKNRRVDFRFI
jgi:outer membrane protein OmpA-like peptidoglycan-associated protein